MVALLIIDMLKDFIEKGAVLEVPQGRDIINNIRRLIDAAHSKGVPVIYICDAHSKDDHEFKYWPPHAIKGTRGAEVINELSPSEGDIVIEKRRYSGFFQTDLDLTLRERNIKSLILTGVLTNVCVFFTAADAFMRGYNLIIVSDGTASLSKEDHTWSLNQAKNILKAEILNTEEVIRKYLS